MNATKLAASLVRVAARHSGLSAQQIIGKGRSVPCCEARRAVWAAMRESGLTYMQIGELFERDHGSIIKGLRSSQKHHGPREAEFRRLCEAVRNHDSAECGEIVQIGGA